VVVCVFFLGHVCLLSIVILFVFFPGAVRPYTVFWGCIRSTLHQRVLLGRRGACAVGTCHSRIACSDPKLRALCFHVCVKTDGAESLVYAADLQLHWCRITFTSLAVQTWPEGTPTNVGLLHRCCHVLHIYETRHNVAE